MAENPPGIPTCSTTGWLTTPYLSNSISTKSIACSSGVHGSPTAVTSDQSPVSATGWAICTRARLREEDGMRALTVPLAAARATANALLVLTVPLAAARATANALLVMRPSRTNPHNASSNAAVDHPAATNSPVAGSIIDSGCCSHIARARCSSWFAA